MDYKNEFAQQLHVLTTAELHRLFGPAMVYADAAVVLNVSVDAVKQRVSRTRDFPPPLPHTKTRMFATPLFAAWLLGIPMTTSEPESYVPPRRGPGRPRKVRAGGAA